MHEYDQIPESLKLALKREFRSQVQIPAGFDAQIISGARSHFRRGRFLRRMTFISSGVAAAIVVGVATIFWNTPAKPALSMDINHDQRVDILDALASARQGNAPQAEAIAKQIVRIGGRQ